jgi:hypothetical protein
MNISKDGLKHKDQDCLQPGIMACTQIILLILIMDFQGTIQFFLKLYNKFIISCNGYFFCSGAKIMCISSVIVNTNRPAILHTGSQVGDSHQSPKAIENVEAVVF